MLVEKYGFCEYVAKIQQNGVELHVRQRQPFVAFQRSGERLFVND
jgi:hypothetical protein